MTSLFPVHLISLVIDKEYRVSLKVIYQLIGNGRALLWKPGSTLPRILWEVFWGIGGRLCAGGREGCSIMGIWEERWGIFVSGRLGGGMEGTDGALNSYLPMSGRKSSPPHWTRSVCCCFQFSVVNPKSREYQSYPLLFSDFYFPFNQNLLKF